MEKILQTKYLENDKVPPMRKMAEGDASYSTCFFM